jgi:HK97 family phage prohead protease
VIERKSLTLQVKRADDSGFLVYAGAFGNVDAQGDVIEPGAFANLESYVVDGVVLLGHDSKGLPLGYPETATQDAYGLLVGGKWHSTARAQEARTVFLERQQAGKSVMCSIGYDVIECHYVDAAGNPVDTANAFQRDGSGDFKRRQDVIRVITKLNVYEFSFVNIPANPEARAVAVKTLTELEKEAADIVLDAKAGRKTMATKRLKEVETFGKRIKRIATAMAEAEELLGLAEVEEAADEAEETSEDEAIEEARRKRRKRRKQEALDEAMDDEAEDKFDGPDDEADYDDEDKDEDEEDEEKDGDDEAEKARRKLLHKLRIRQLKGRSLDLAAIDDD